MRKIPFLPLLLLAVLSFFITTNIQSQTLTEGFETGLPTSGSSTAQDFTLGSGVWTVLKGASSSTKHNGSLGLKLSAGSVTTPTYAAAPALNAVTSVSFWAKGSSNTTVTIQKSVNGAAYTTVTTQAITTTFTQYTINVNETGSNVRIKLANATSQTIYIDDVTINYGTATPTPALTITPTSLSYGNVTTNTTSAEKTYAVSGANLSPASGSITITAPAGYQVTTISGSGYATSATVAYTGGALAATTIYVVFKPTAAQAYTGNISNAGGGAATQNVAVSGTGVALTPSLSVTPTSLAFGNVTANTTSAEKTYAVSGVNLSPASGSITVTAPTGYQLTTTSGSGYATSTTIAYSGSTLAATTIYVVFNPTAAQSYTGTITNAGGGAATQNVAVSGTGVVLTPALSVTPTSLAFGNVTANTTSAEKTYAVSGVNLTPASGSITVTAPTGYQLTTTSGTGYASSATVSYSGGSLAATTLYVVFKPTAAQSYTGNITNAGGGAATQNVAVSGTGVVLTPALTVSPASLAFGSVNINTTSAEKTYSISGVNLTPASGSITVTAPSGYQVTTTSGSGYASSATVSYSGGSLAATTLYVVFKPTAAQSYTGNITNAGGGATTQNVAVTGTGTQVVSSSTIIYVSPTGSDSNPGTFALPYATITKAIAQVTAGDTIYVRGGNYTTTKVISISKSGTASAKYYLLAYPGERPVLDCSSMSVSGSNRGINLTGSYWYIKGISIYHAGDNGMNISGSNNTVEFCSFYENSDTGLQLGVGAANNQIINCDSYYNADPANGNADGFSPKLDVGSGNYFYGCRAWQNSDDGYDGYLRGTDNVNTTLENCWAFKNGYLKDGSQSAGNGNGFKMGGSDDKTLNHNFTLKNCLSFQNLVKGFDQNNNKGSMTLYNCTAFSNGSYNFSIPSALNSGHTATITNCISLGSTLNLGSFVVQTTDSWSSGFSVSAADFLSTDATPAYGPRNADGSLPNSNFMHLAATSHLIDRGTNVGLPFNGTAPDLGCYETSGTGSRPAFSVAPLSTLSVAPNVFTTSAHIDFSTANGGNAYVAVVNNFGQIVAVLYNGTTVAGNDYTLQFNAGALSPGIYYAVLQNGTDKMAQPMVIGK